MLPVLPVNDVAAALTYYTDVLGFDEVFRMPGPDGTLLNGQVAFHGSQLMFNLNPAMADQQGGGVYFWIRVDDMDIDAYYATLKDKGVTITEEIKDQFWGDRSFSAQDANGYNLAFNKALAQR